MQQQAHNFWTDTVDDWYTRLNSSATGINNEQAERIYSANGFERRERLSIVKDLMLFLNQFKNPLMLMLIGAVILSAALGDRSDVFIILFIVVSTSLLSFFQERNAGKTVEKLQALISIKSTVLRSGQECIVAASRIVPGDVLLLKAGDILPADCLIIESNELFTNESSLTGESFPVTKQAGVVAADTALAARSNCLWEGSSVISGNARALVVCAGDQTIFGQLKESADMSVETSFEKGLRQFGYFLMKITIVLASFVLLVNLFNRTGIIESAMFSLALAVGMAPEMLPAITTIAMSAGAKRLLAKKVIVRKLNAIQNLGEINLLCTDKTGTITKGEIEIAGTVNGQDHDDLFVKQLAYWNAFFESGYTNPIDTALKTLALELPAGLSKTDEIPYDFNRKRLSICLRQTEGNILISKGAFTNIMSICKQIRQDDGQVVAIDAARNSLDALFASYGEKGLRAIAVCYKPTSKTNIRVEDECDMIFAGFVLMHDPIKASIPGAIQKLNDLNVCLKIITGDNANIAHSIARQIGIAQPVILSGKELPGMSREELEQRAGAVDVFAEVEPQQKEHIIQALKNQFTVAYMGDGINDVAAIRAADVGISVDNAVDVAREAADFVLTENDLSVLSNGIQEGRKTFANTLKYIYINTGSTFGNMFSMAAASLMLPFLPMLPKQILLTNFLTDFPFLTVSSDNVDAEQVSKPGRWNIRHVRNYMVIFGLHSTLFDLATFLTLYHVLRFRETSFQTGWFIESILTELLILFVIRTRRSFIKSKPGKYLGLVSLVALVLTLSIPYLPFAGDLGFTPLPLPYLGIVIGIVVTYILTADLLKIWFFRKYAGIE